MAWTLGPKGNIPLLVRDARDREGRLCAALLTRISNAAEFGYGRADDGSTMLGNILVTIAGGSVSGLMVSLADLQLAGALMLYINGDKRIPIRCAIGPLLFQHGVVTLDKTLMDTQKSVLRPDPWTAYDAVEWPGRWAVGPRTADWRTAFPIKAAETLVFMAIEAALQLIRLPSCGQARRSVKLRLGLGSEFPNLSRDVSLRDETTAA